MPQYLYLTMMMMRRNKTKIEPCRLKCEFSFLFE
jgi:hypothetical protein